MRNLLALEIHRFRDCSEQVRTLYGGVGDETCGVFSVPSPVDSKYMRVIASAGEGWDHVSVSRTNRTPTWGEMEHVKRIFFEPDEVCMQLHVAEREHISFHAFCLHIWRPLDATIPLPPPWMVA